METLAPPKSEIYNRELRAYNDATTWLAEALDGRMRTSFDYHFDGRELYADDGSELKPIFLDALEEAADLAAENPSLAFEQRRRQIELDEYDDMIRMATGELPNTMVVISDFPPELMNAKSDVGGYNVARKQTMLRVITRRPDGRIEMQSQSLDGSNRLALEAIYNSFGLEPTDGELLGQRIHSQQDEYNQEFLLDKLTGAYDRTLEAQNPGQRYRAGRRQPDKPDIETHYFVQTQSDLIDYLTARMLAGKMDEQTMFSVAATMTSRYEKAASVTNSTSETNYYRQTNKSHVRQELEREMMQASASAMQAGRTFSGCGASVGFGGGLGADGQLKASGFGNKAEDECEFTSKECPKCHKKNVKTVSKNGKYYGACGCHS